MWISKYSSKENLKLKTGRVIACCLASCGCNQKWLNKAAVVQALFHNFSVIHESTALYLSVKLHSLICSLLQLCFTLFFKTQNGKRIIEIQRGSVSVRWTLRDLITWSVIQRGLILLTSTSCEIGHAVQLRICTVWATEECNQLDLQAKIAGIRQSGGAIRGIYMTCTTPIRGKITALVTAP